MLIRGHQDTFLMYGEEFSMKDWNPLLLALAYKQSEVVKYLIANQKLSVRVAGRDPRYLYKDAINNNDYETEKIDRQMFCMKIVVSNEDLECLHLLWDQY